MLPEKISKITAQFMRIAGLKPNFGKADGDEVEGHQIQSWSMLI